MAFFLFCGRQRQQNAVKCLTQEAWGLCLFSGKGLSSLPSHGSSLADQILSIIQKQLREKSFLGIMTSSFSHSFKKRIIFPRGQLPFQAFISTAAQSQASLGSSTNLTHLSIQTIPSGISRVIAQPAFPSHRFILFSSADSVLRAWSHCKKKRGENLKRMLFFNTYLHLCFSLLKNNLNLKAESHYMHLVCCWDEGRWVYRWNTEHINLGTQIMKMTQSSEWVQKELPLDQPLGVYEVRYTAFPFSLFSLPMSSARAQPGLSSSPPALRPLPGGGKNSSPSPCLGKVDLGNQTADVHPQLEQGTHRARSFTAFFSHSSSGLALSTPAPCR